MDERLYCAPVFQHLAAHFHYDHRHIRVGIGLKHIIKLQHFHDGHELGAYLHDFFFRLLMQLGCLFELHFQLCDAPVFVVHFISQTAR